MSFPAVQPPPRQPSPLPRRTDSLSSSIAKPKPTSPLVQSKEDVRLAGVVLNTQITREEDAGMDEEGRERRREERERELIEMLGRMTGWVEELTTLLQQAYKNQTDLETALTLTRSNLQLALANNEMLEEALKRGGKDVGWRRWSEREGVRRTSSVKEFTQHERPNSVPELPPQTIPSPPQQQQQQSGPSRFFNFKSPLQRASSNNTSPTTQEPSAPVSPPYSHSASASTSSLLPSISIPPSSRSGTPVQVNGVPMTPPTPPTAGSSAASSSRASPPPSPSEREKALAAMLAKERTALKTVATEKAQLEDELESLSQALFEEANKMVSKANRKLAETEEELRVATAQKEALKGALRIVEGENGQLRGQPARGSPSGSVRRVDDAELDRGRQRERATTNGGELSEQTQGHERHPDVGTPVRTDHPPAAATALAPEPAAPPPPSSVSTSAPVPSFTVTGAPESFWSPVSPSSNIPSPSSASTPLTPTPSTSAPVHSPRTADTPLIARSPLSAHSPFTSRGGHRWSVMPNTPRSRSAVRNEFEEAMRRMQDMVGEDGVVLAEGGDAGAGAGAEDEGAGPERDSEAESPHEDELASPRIEFARKSSESEVEDELDVRAKEGHPWTA